METLKIELQNDQEKKVLLAFLDSLSYKYSSDTDTYGLSDAQIRELVKRKADFIAGKTTSRPWDEIKKKYEKV